MSKDRPFNFNLNPPTPNRYIDAILSAQVEGLRYLISEDPLKNKIQPLPKEIDNFILTQFKKFNDEDINDIYYYFDL